MEAHLAREAYLEPWDPTAELRLLDNQAYFAQILPHLQTVKVIKNGDLPAVAEVSRDFIVSEVGPKLGVQDKLLASTEAVQAFTPTETAVDQETAQEEALVRSLHLSLVQGALVAASSGFVSFEAANQDLVLLLGSLNRPTHRYRQLSETKRNFMDRYYDTARRSGFLGSERLKSFRHVMALTVCHAVVDSPAAVRTIAEEASAAKEAGPATVHQLHPEENDDSKLEVGVNDWDTAWGEIDFPASPWLKAFLREFRFDKRNLPKTSEEAIQQVDVAESNLGASKFTKELMGRLGVAAYMETLAMDAEEQEANGSVATALAFITKSEDGVTARIIQLANQVSKMGREALKQKRQAEISPIKTNRFPQLEALPESLPRAFSVLRLVMTQLGRQPVVESPTTKELGTIVEAVLTTAYPK